SLGGTPLASSFLADSILLSVLFGLGAAFRPTILAKSTPGAVRNNVNSAYIYARHANNLNKKPPECVALN
ncbi:hypothetical protein, partial [Enterobacter hormaechei]